MIRVRYIIVAGTIGLAVAGLAAEAAALFLKSGGSSAIQGPPAVLLGPTTISASSFGAVAGDANTSIGYLSTLMTPSSQTAIPSYTLAPTCTPSTDCADNQFFTIPPKPITLTLTPVSTSLLTGAASGTVIATANCVMSDNSLCATTLQTSDTTFFAISGLSIVTQHTLTSADIGSHPTTITASGGNVSNNLYVGASDLVCPGTSCQYQITVRDTDQNLQATNSPFDQHLTLTGTNTQLASHIQSITGAATISGSSATTPIFTAIKNGDSVIGSVNANAQLLSVVDNLGHAAALAPLNVQFGTIPYYQSFASLINVPGGATSLTMTFATAPTSVWFNGDEYIDVTGLDGNNLSYNANATNSTAPALGITTASDGDVIWSYLNPKGSSTTTAGSGFTARVSNAPIQAFTEDQTQTTHGTMNATWTMTPGQSFMIANAGLIVGVPPSPPTVTVNGTMTPTVVAGSSAAVAVNNGPGNCRDWVGIYAVGTSGNPRSLWNYLNGSQTPPTSCVSSASFNMTVPGTAGSYVAAFYSNDTYTQLAAILVTVTPGQQVTITSLDLNGGTTASFAGPTPARLSLGPIHVVCSNNTCNGIIVSLSNSQGGCSSTNGAGNGNFTLSSADNSTIVAPNGGSLQTTLGAWSWGAAHPGTSDYWLLFNGVQQTGYGTQMQITNGQLYVLNAAATWYVLGSSNTFVSTAAPSQGPVPSSQALLVNSGVAAGTYAVCVIAAG